MLEIQKLSTDSVSISCDPEILDDLIMILSKLIDMAKYIKNQKRIQAAEDKAHRLEALAASQARWEEVSSEIYQRYQALSRETSERSKLITLLKSEFACDSYTVGLHLAEGKRQEKARVHEKIKQEASLGKSITEIQAFYGLSYNTIKRILEK